MNFLFYTLIMVFVFPKRANAYLDPGTGSYIIQVVIALFVTGGFLIKTYWQKLKNIFNKKSNEGKSQA